MTHMIEVLHISVTINRPYPYGDDVELTIDCDPGYPDEDECTLHVKTERDKGVEWAKNNFPGMEIEVVDYETGKVRKEK